METECYSLPAEGGDANESQSFFGLNPKSDRVAVSSNGSLIFFSGISSGGGSGFLESFALLQYNNNGKISNLLPRIHIADGGDRHVWLLSSVSQMPILAFAEAIWGEGEAHYGDLHFYTVSAYTFDLKAHQYTKHVQYVTSKKYSDKDADKQVRVLAAEKSEIIAKLIDGHHSEEMPNLESKVSVPKPIPEIASPELIKRRLIGCILPKAQYGRYSSYDGGKSVIDLMEACPEESVAFTNQCEASGRSTEGCDTQLAIVLQAAIKQFGK